MRNRLYLATVLGVALCGAHVYGQFGGKPSALSTIKLRDDLFVIHNDFVPGNTTVLVTNDGVVMVDDKFEVDHANILAELKKITNQPVKYVINTHHHGDHSGSNAQFQKTNATIVATEAARVNMVDGKQPGQPTMTFDRQATIALGGKLVRLYYFGRAHTNGDLVAHFPAHRALAAGDMYTVGGKSCGSSGTRRSSSGTRSTT
jgi:glyoxylase-like metal-dependent hydrolase (beta-lactamase superfamily II)